MTAEEKLEKAESILPKKRDEGVLLELIRQLISVIVVLTGESRATCEEVNELTAVLSQLVEKIEQLAKQRSEDLGEDAAWRKFIGNLFMAQGKTLDQIIANQAAQAQTKETTRRTKIELAWKWATRVVAALETLFILVITGYFGYTRIFGG